MEVEGGGRDQGGSEGPKPGEEEEDMAKEEEDMAEVLEEEDMAEVVEEEEARATETSSSCSNWLAFKIR